MKKTVAAVVLAAVLFLFSACSENIYLNNGADGDGSYDIIQSIPDSSDKTRIYNTLYYCMDGYDYMLPELREISYQQDISKEYAVLSELINGTQNKDLVNLINKNTRILGITTNNDYIYVSLSKEILEVPASINSAWENDAELSRKVYRQRRLAIYTLVNTLTELGGYARVQLYIDLNADGVADRVNREQAGFIGDGNEQQPLEALPRQHDYILTPANTVRLAMGMLAANQTEQLYQLVAEESYTGSQKLTKEEFAARMSALKLTVGDYSVSDNAAITGGGAIAVVMLDYISRSAGGTFEHKNIPVTLVLEGNRYYIDCSFLEYVLKG